MYSVAAAKRRIFYRTRKIRDLNCVELQTVISTTNPKCLPLRLRGSWSEDLGDCELVTQHERQPL